VDRAALLAPLGHLNLLTAAGATPLAETIASDIPLSLDPGGRVLSGAFAPAMSGMYALKLTDETGLSGSRLLEVRLIPDPAPKVMLPSVSPCPGVFVPLT